MNRDNLDFLLFLTVRIDHVVKPDCEAGSRTLQSHPCPHFYPVYLFLSISHLRSLPLSLSGPMLTFWLMEKQQLGLCGTDMRLARRVCEQMFQLETSGSLYGREIKALSCSTILTGSPLFSPNWPGSFNSTSLCYENPPVWPAPHAGFPFCLLQVW